MLRALGLGLLMTALLPASAQAIVGGKHLRASAAPWFSQVGICGGTLIAPDRVATAAHCVDPINLEDFENVRVGGEARRGVRVALPATWREQRSGFAADDVAIVQTRVDSPTGATPLRMATLAGVRDGDCARRWKRSRNKLRNRFRAASEVCATGKASVCNGDSGGPMISGTLKRPRLVGIISWTGECGTDGLPSVGEEAAHYRDFLTAAEPVWAPVPDGPTRATLANGVLICELPTWSVAPDRVEVRWQRRTRVKDGYRFETVSRAPTYTPTAQDRGKLLDCQALGSNAGGRTLTPHGGSIRVPR